MTGKEMVGLLLKNGWELISIKGSHHKMRKGMITVIVPVHGNKDLKKGLESDILKQADLK